MAAEQVNVLPPSDGSPLAGGEAAAAAAAAIPVARCPLGFNGSLPAGHPSIPGFDLKSPSTSKPSGVAAAMWIEEIKSWIPTTTRYKDWTTKQLLFADAVFLLLCVVVAVYLPAGRSRTAGTTTSSSSSSSSSPIPRTDTTKGLKQE